MGETSATPMKKLLLSALVAVVSILPLKADTFGTGGNQFTLDFTSIGNAGNAADPTTGYGAVPYAYRIGTYTISQNQIDAATANGLLGVTAGPWSGNQPAANITWYQAAAFANYLNTSTGHQAAYDLTYADRSGWSMALWNAGTAGAGYDANNQYRNSLAKYFLPSENDWYKAAYYDPTLNSGAGGYWLYPEGINTAPRDVASGTEAGTAVYNGAASVPASVYQAGGLSPYGTMGQGGNDWQWLESAWDGSNNSETEARGIRGGYWGPINGDVNLLSSLRTYYNPDVPTYGVGFRVASVADAVPEPSTYALFALGIIGTLLAIRRKHLC